MKTSILKLTSAVGLLLQAFTALPQSIGELRGTITDSEQEPIPYATIRIYQDQQLVGGSQTDLNGRYSYKPLIPGTYELLVSEAGHQTQPVNKVKVIANDPTYVDVILSANILGGTVVVVAPPIDYTRSGVDKTMFNQVSMDALELNRNAGYTRGDIQGTLENMTTDVISTGDGEVHFRGARSDAAGYFVDGVRTLNANTIPGLAIENITIFPGGVPAMYGDISSGVVMITTWSYFSGIREKNVLLAAKKERREKARKEKEEAGEQKSQADKQ